MRRYSPYKDQRAEDQTAWIYYLPDEPGIISEGMIFEDLEEGKSVYIFGTRGTGKTTLLQALNIETRLVNNSLLKELGDNPFRNSFLGLYFKVPRQEFTEFPQYINIFDEGEKSRIIALWFDLIWLEKLFRILDEMIITDKINITGEEEEQLLLRIVRDHQELNSFFGEAIPLNFIGFANLLSKFKKSIFISIRKGSNKENELFERIIQYNIGELGHIISPYIISLLSTSLPSKQKWHIKVLIDEAERLDEFQQNVLNTIVAIKEGPIRYVVSYGTTPSTIDYSSTLIEDMTLTTADREVVSLFEMSDDAFRIFVEKVVEKRLKYNNVDITRPYQTQDILGKLHVNELIEHCLRKSITNTIKWQEYVNITEKRLKENGYYDYERNTTSSALPHYQAFLIQRGIVNFKKLCSPSKKDRDQAHAEMRKREVSAYLNLLKEYQVKPQYATADVLLKLCDKSIRDYFMQMDEILVKSDLPIEKFLRTRISIDDQDASIKQRSAKKANSFERSEINTPMKSKNLINGLGQIVKIFQTQGVDNEMLKTNERGMFHINLSTINKELADDLNQLYTIIMACNKAGYLIVKSYNYEEIKFRLHCSLSPAFEISYRPATYPVSKIMAHQLLHILTLKFDQVTPYAKSVAKAIIENRGVNPNQETLNLDY